MRAAALSARRRQRGYNLVEVGIVLAVLGLLLGASLVPLGQLWKSSAYRAEMETLRSHQDAILGYALANGTPAVEVEARGSVLNVFNFFYPEYVQPHQLPAGRPYLPCPDVDGDGYEDRQPVAPSIIVVSETLPGLLREGNCLLSRGTLPWKTLGTAAADAWGNRYTYQVDDVLSNAAVGFTEETATDVFDRRLQITVTADGDINYRPRRDDVPLVVNIGGANVNYANKRRPIIVCGAGASAAQVCHPDRQPLLRGGERATLAFNIRRKAYAVGDVLEGVAYVIVSHGANGFGAVSHGNSSPLELRCNAPVASASASAGSVQLGYEMRDEAVNFPFVEETLPDGQRYCAPVELTTSAGNLDLRSGFFAAANRVQTSGAEGRTYDDAVVWMTRHEMVQALTQVHRLPQGEPLPVFGLY